jgi:hypothetical protein
LYPKQDSSRHANVSARTSSNEKLTMAHRVVALHLDFVAKPEGARDLNGELGSALTEAGLVDEGLETALLLVSDREARLVTLLTFWNAARFADARKRRIAWMQKLLAPFADGPVRAQTSAPRFVLAQPCAEFSMDKGLWDGATELEQVAG